MNDTDLQRGDWEIFIGAKRLWWWRFRAPNGILQAGGLEGFAGKRNVKRGITDFLHNLGAGHIVPRIVEVEA